MRRYLLLAVAAIATGCSDNLPPEAQYLCTGCEAACHLCFGSVCAAADAGMPDPRCGAYRCGDDAGCLASCTGPEQCQDGAYCDGGQCFGYLALGDPCFGAGECASGGCADGVCCDSACDGGCDRCDLAGLIGTCTPVPAGSAGAPSCAPYVCAGAASCPSSCADDTGCTGTTYCEGAGCVPKKPSAQGCAGPNQCVSGACADGVCCDSACSGACDACDVTGSVGTCLPVAAASQGAPSCAPYLCDGTAASCPGTCSADPACASGSFCSGTACVPKLASGQACARAAQCTSGFCADGVCCGTACSGACDACDLAASLGTCAAAPAGRPGRPSCAPFVCTGLSRSCPASCTTNAQCATGRACSGGACLADTDADGTADADDCAAADPLKWSNRTCYSDGDNDGFVSLTGAPVCSGAACPAGTQATAGTDCNDGDPLKYQSITCHGGPDVDADTFHAGTGVSTCTGAACPAGTSSLRDCYDSNANAKPGQLGYFDVNRGDSSFDYDCDGLQSKSPAWDCVTSYAGVAGCVAPSSAYTGQRGYVGASPACGVAGTYRTCASWSNATCSSAIFQYATCGTGCFPVGLSYSVQEVSLTMLCR
ncbi:MAG: hypothetical protein ACYC8T_30205 [Myxococcaceae bacterium]